MKGVCYIFFKMHSKCFDSLRLLTSKYPFPFHLILHPPQKITRIILFSFFFFRFWLPCLFWLHTNKNPRCISKYQLVVLICLSKNPAIYFWQILSLYTHTKLSERWCMLFVILMMCSGCWIGRHANHKNVKEFLKQNEWLFDSYPLWS